MAVFSLTAHFIADAACRSPEFPDMLQCDSGQNSNLAGGGQYATPSLHSSFVLPDMTIIGRLPTLASTLISASSIPLLRFFPPPVRPPIVPF